MYHQTLFIHDHQMNKTNSVSEMSQKSKGWATEYFENQN